MTPPPVARCLDIPRLRFFKICGSDSDVPEFADIRDIPFLSYRTDPSKMRFLDLREGAALEGEYPDDAAGGFCRFSVPMCP